MAGKKYVLKTAEEKPQDGTLNEEHIMDIIAEFEVSFENIQDNNDICMQMYEAMKGKIDEDVLDAIQIACENSIEIEKEASQIFEIISKVKENIEKYDKSSEFDLQNLLKQMKGFEKKSKKIMESVIKN